jgi:hypothetical protein
MLQKVGKIFNDSTSNISGATFMSATGGTPTCGNFKIHTFTSD